MRTLFTRLVVAGLQSERGKVLRSGGGNKGKKCDEMKLKTVERFSNEVLGASAHGETERVILCSAEETDIDVDSLSTRSMKWIVRSRRKVVR